MTLVVLVAGFALAGCGSDTSTATPSVPATPGSAAGLATPASPASPATPASPVTGVLVKIDSQGLTKIRGFILRTDAGTEIPFTIGRLENGAEFPPGHLAEHMSTSSPVRVFFRDQGGTLVVHRIEDAE